MIFAIHPSSVLPVVVAVLLAAAPAPAKTARYVSTNGSDTGNDCAINLCATIGHALDEADPGDWISIADGTYTETLNIDKDISLQGASAGGAIIQAAATPRMSVTLHLSYD